MFVFRYTVDHIYAQFLVTELAVMRESVVGMRENPGEFGAGMGCGTVAMTMRDTML